MLLLLLLLFIVLCIWKLILVDLYVGRALSWLMFVHKTSKKLSPSSQRKIRTKQRANTHHTNTLVSRIDHTYTPVHDNSHIHTHNAMHACIGICVCIACTLYSQLCIQSFELWCGATKITLDSNQTKQNKTNIKRKKPMNIARITIIFHHLLQFKQRNFHFSLSSIIILLILYGNRFAFNSSNISMVKN